MALVDTAPRARSRDIRADWRPWLALGVAAFNVVAYVLVLVVPYYAAGAPDPTVPMAEDVAWPYPSAMNIVLTPMFFWVLGIGWFAGVCVAGWSALRLWFTRGVPGGRAVLWTALVVSVATLTWLVVQGAQILIWTLD